jgi:autotransporter-associated beta strand protein
VGEIIGPWATWGTTAAAQSDYATYNRTAGGAVNAFGIQNASIGATADTTWTDSTKAYTNNTSALALGAAVHNMSALRNTAATATITISTASGNLNTYGLLNGVGTLLTVAATGTGALSTPSGGGNLFVTTGSGAITVSAPINNNGLDAATLVKSGSGLLLLNSATSNYSGGTVINAGQLRIASNAALGNSSGSITLNGGALLGNTTNPQVGNAGGANITSARDVIVGVAGGSIGAHGNNNFTTSGKLSGTGTLTMLALGGGGGQTLNFNSTSNDFTGGIVISTGNGTFTINSLVDSANNIVFNGTTGAVFTYNTGATAPLVLNSRSFAITSSFSNTISNLNTTQGMTINTPLLVTASGALTLTLNAAAGPTNAFAGNITNGTGGGTIGLTKSGAGIWNVSGTNTHSGTTTVSAGTLELSNGAAIADTGAVSIANVATAILKLNANETIGSLAGGGTLGGTLNLQGNTLTVGGSTGSFGGVIQGVGGALTKTVAGILTLTGANSYTGATTVSGGQLTVSGTGTLAGTSGLSVSGGATFSYQPTTIGTALILGTGSTLNLADGSALGLTWNASTASNIVALGAATIGNGAGVALNMTGAYTPDTTYTILTALSGLDTGTYVILNPTDYTAVVAKSPDSVKITPTTATALTAAYWTGTTTVGVTKVWAASDGSASNWASSDGGAAQGLVPGSGADVTISSSTVAVAPTATTLGANMTIKTLTIADTTTGLGLDADGYTLTITPTAATGGIIMNANVPACTIAAKVALGANQTWTNDSAAPLTVSGGVSGAFGLTKAGSGTLILSGVNTFAGTLAVDVGTLALSPVGAGAFTMSNALSGAGTLSVNPFAANGSNLTLTGNLSGFTGTVNVGTSGGFNSKLATTGVTSSFGAGTVVNIANGGTWLNTAPQTGITVNLSGTGNSENLGALRLDNTTLDITSSVVLKADGSIGGTGSSTINAPISEDGGSFSLTKQDTGTLFLGGANSYSGLTTVSAGVLVVQNASALGTTAVGTSVADAARVELDNLTVTGEAITLVGAGTNNIGSLQGRAGTSVWAGPVTVDASLTRIGAITGASLEVSGVIDDGVNDYRVRFRPQSATATVIVSGANTYTGGTSIFGGPVVVSSLNSVVGGTASSNLGAPVTEANGMIILGIAGTVNDGTLRYIGAGETTDRTFQIGDNSAAPVVGDNGGGAIENNGATGPLVFSAPSFNTPTNALTGTSPARTLTLGGTNTAANTISGVIQDNEVAGVGTAAVGLTKAGLGNWTLAGANTYTGNTTVTGGTLQIDGSYAVAGSGTTSQLLVGSGAATNGTVVIGTSAGTVTFGGNGFATAAQIGVSGGTGALTINGGIVNLAGTTGTAATSLHIGVQVATAAGTGTVTVNAGTLNVGQRILMGANNAASTGTLTIAGGTVNVGSNGTLGYTGNNPGIVQYGNGTGTLNLGSGGTLKLFGFKSSGGAATNINFNGGTLVALGSPAFFMGNNGASDAAPTAVGTFTTQVKAGGAMIDTNGFNITIPSNLVEDAGSPGGGLTKQGAGVLTLTGANTYTGTTDVSNGVLALVGGSQTSAVTVDTGASLGFTVGSTTTSTSTVNFDTGSTVTITGTPSLPSYTLMTALSFTGIVPVLAAPVAGYELQVDGFTTLKLVQVGYSSWAAVNGAGVNLDDDHDADGVTNGVEYFIGGPAGNTTGFTALPGVINTLGTLSVTWPKGAGYGGAYTTDFVVETSATLSGPWTAETIGGGNIVDTANPGGSVKYTFPGPLSGKKFARLKVTGP